MPRVRIIIDFDKGRIVVYRDCVFYRIAVLLLVSVEIQCFFPEYGIDVFSAVIRNTVLDLNGPLSLAAEKTGMLPAWPLWILQLRHDP
ncbi:hypothetical protein TNCV_1078711 [Trichonephila clavipes]|nr:hypothetical protein TNCV_1078711 [Trichonephila clavipes]